jgi:hypothetical protein
MSDKHLLRVIVVMLLISVSSAPALRAQTVEPATADTPSISFYSMIASDELYEALKKQPGFQTLDKEKLGSPLHIRVSLEYGRANSAGNVASAILSIGTLGLLPVADNRDLLLTYDVLLNESVFASYTYSKRVTHMFSMYAKDKTHGLGDDGLAWVIGTSNQFAGDLMRDPKYADLNSEYRLYYGTPLATGH